MAGTCLPWAEVSFEAAWRIHAGASSALAETADSASATTEQARSGKNPKRKRRANLEPVLILYPIMSIPISA
jgi:hypothetical protein